MGRRVPNIFHAHERHRLIFAIYQPSRADFARLGQFDHGHR